MNKKDKIAEGTYREVFLSQNGEFCIKTVGKKRKKRRCFITFHIRGDIYAKYKYGIPDLNEYEFQNMQKCASFMQNYMPEEFFLDDGDLVTTTQRDFDGKISETIESVRPSPRHNIWGKVEDLVSICRDNSCYFMDIFKRGDNLLVVKDTPDEWRPVIIDFKSIGRVMYPFQPELRFKYFLERKFERRLKRFYESFRS